jgi:hypothetical protein
MKNKKQKIDDVPILPCDDLFLIYHAIDYKLAVNEKLHWDIVSVLSHCKESNHGEIIDALRRDTYKLEKAREKLGKIYYNQFPKK